MKPFYLLTAFFLVPLLSLAQSNYHQGYVLLSNGDTVRGYINSREWELTPKTIEFKKNTIDKQAITYSPSALKGFEIASTSKYISYIGKISMDPTEFNNAPSGLDTSSRQDTVFLKVIYSGSKASLLGNADIIKQRLFIQETGQIPTELKFHQYLNGDNKLVSTTIYKGQLRYIASKYNASEKTLRYIDGIDYTQGDIEKAVLYINGQTTLPKEASITRFFIGAEAVNHTTSFKGISSFTNSGKANSANPALSLGYDIFQNPHTQKLIIRTELLLGYIAPKFSYPVLYTATPATASYHFNQLSLAFSPQIIYNVYNSDALKAYLGVGIGFNFSSYSNNKFTVDGDYPESENNYYELRGFWINFPLKAGVMINKRWDIFALYTSPATYTNYVNFSIVTSTIGLGVHYCFDKNSR